MNWHRLGSRTHFFKFFCAATLVCLILSGCAKGHFGSSIPKSQLNTFRYPLITDPTTLDPAIVQDGDTIDVIQQIFEGLVRFGQDNSIKPALATSWDIKDQGKTYIFHIRKGVTFSNGQALTANDFKFSIDRACNPAIKSATASDYLANVVGVQRCLDGKVKGVSGVKVLSKYRLEIDLKIPAYYFLGDLTYPVAYAVASQSVSANSPITDVSQMIGTGPFIATKYIHDQVFSMKANPTYYLGKPKIDGIERPIVKEAITRLNMFKSNQIDLVQLMRQDVIALEKDPKYKKELHFYPRPSTYYIAFNQLAYKPFANVHVRRAFAMAVDCKSICDKVLQGLNPVANGILPPGVVGYRTQTALLGYHPNQARSELAEGGYKDGSQLPPLKLYFRSDQEDVRIVAEAVQSYLKQNLHVNVQLAPLDWGTYLQKNDENQLPFYHMRWEADYLDPQDWLSLLLTTHGQENHEGFSNSEVDALCAQADPMPTDDPKRLALYAKAEDICLQQAAWLPIYYQQDVELISPRVQGIRSSIFGHLPHSTVWLKN